MKRNLMPTPLVQEENWRKWVLWLLLCAALIGSTVIYKQYVGGAGAEQRSFLGIPISPYEQNTPPRLGAAHGVRLAIPANYLFFPVEYEGEDSWAPKKTKPVRTPESEISSFSVYVQWPTLLPRQDSNEESYQDSFKTRGLRPHEWLMISVEPHNLKPPTSPGGINYMLEDRPDNYLGRRTRSSLDLLDPTDPGRPKDLSPQVHFEYRAQPALGLQSAIPVGPGTEWSDNHWNNAIYWQGIPGAVVTTYIQCTRGKNVYGNELAGDCKHSFELKEFKANVQVNYTANLLPQWQSIEEQARRLMLSFRAGPEYGTTIKN